MLIFLFYFFLFTEFRKVAPMLKLEHRRGAARKKDSAKGLAQRIFGAAREI